MGIESKIMTLEEYTERVNVDMRNTDSIGVLCRGQSLKRLDMISDKFKKLYLVGQFTNALPRLARHLQGKKIIQIINKVSTQTSEDICNRFNIQDIQCSFDGWLHRIPSESRQQLFNKVISKNNWATVHLLPPGIREARPEGFDWVTCGILGVDLAAFWKPRHIWIAGLDFYFSRYFADEERNGSCGRERRLKMIEMLKLLVKRDPKITFHLLTYCKHIESFDNLRVTHMS